MVAGGDGHAGGGIGGVRNLAANPAGRYGPPPPRLGPASTHSRLPQPGSPSNSITASTNARNHGSRTTDSA